MQRRHIRGPRRDREEGKPTSSDYIVRFLSPSVLLLFSLSLFSLSLLTHTLQHSYPYSIANLSDSTITMVKAGEYLYLYPFLNRSTIDQGP